jgi:hypothetical protein
VKFVSKISDAHLRLHLGSLCRAELAHQSRSYTIQTDRKIGNFNDFKPTTQADISTNAFLQAKTSSCNSTVPALRYLIGFILAKRFHHQSKKHSFGFS